MRSKPRRPTPAQIQAALRYWRMMFKQPDPDKEKAALGLAPEAAFKITQTSHSNIARAKYKVSV
jgi:hypothetical protein